MYAEDVSSRISQTCHVKMRSRGQRAASLMLSNEGKDFKNTTPRRVEKVMSATPRRVCRPLSQSKRSAVYLVDIWLLRSYSIWYVRYSLDKLVLRRSRKLEEAETTGGNGEWSQSTQLVDFTTRADHSGECLSTTTAQQQLAPDWHSLHRVPELTSDHHPAPRAEASRAPRRLP